MYSKASATRENMHAGKDKTTYVLVFYARKTKDWDANYYDTRERAEQEMKEVREDPNFRPFHTAVMPASELVNFLTARGYPIANRCDARADCDV